MRQRRTRSSSRNNIRRHNRNTNGLNFSQFATALGIGVVLLLLGATFAGDYFRVPGLTVSATPGSISPNGDNTQDNVNFSYQLSEEAEQVTAAIKNSGGIIMKTFPAVSNQAGGHYILTWDGLSDTGQVVPDGRYTLEVIAGGPSRTVSQQAEVLVDTMPPDLRLTNLDKVTRVSDPALTIEGLTEPGAVVYQAGVAQAVPVDNQGRFAIERQLTEGSTIMEVLASDQAGNTSRLSHEVALITKPPELTINQPNNDLWLSDPVVQVQGVAPGAAAITVNENPVTVQTDGTFRHELILQEGDHTLRVEATDDVGNVTIQERLIHIKTGVPNVSLNLNEGATFQQSNVQLTGRTDPGATVLVNSQTVPVSALGEFQTGLNLTNGINTINVEVRDIAGNTTQLQRHVRFESPSAQNEVNRFLNRFPELPALGTPLLIIIPSLMLLGYIFTRPVSLMLGTDNDTFIPGLPEEGKVLAVLVDLSKSARVTVEVLNQFNRPVATITQRRQRSSGQHTLFWDGYDDLGNVVAPGEYTIQATASTPGGAVSSAVGITVYEDPIVHSQYGHRRFTPAQQDVEYLTGRSW